MRNDVNDVMSQQSKNEIFAVATVCLQRDGRYLGVYFLWGGGFKLKKKRTDQQVHRVRTAMALEKTVLASKKGQH